MQDSADFNPGTPRPAVAKRTRRAVAALLISVAVTVLLYFVPYGDRIAYPLLLFSTLVHELGHGVAAVLAGGSFQSFTMSADGSGVATWAASASRLTLAFVSFGGLLGPSVVAAVLFFVGASGHGARFALLVFGIALVVAEVLVVRGGFALLFVAVVATIMLALASKASIGVSQFAVVFLATQLSLSVFSRADYLFTDTAHTAAGTLVSDTGQIAQALLLPYWFWGALTGAVSVLVLWLGLRAFLASMQT